ncbi:bifunctional diguanylate cyclase/phosphodiesterase [Thiorhodococcus minor]|uniref:cyclic-guanylate-specific phosphodiesterase n=1 Tax=Thiorhodococcus minor TaxID=57489 RepID=A0A6M0JTK8_9GAMM|nr:PAS domain S-box protein [Thiorhodococcus minor]NEV60569.1 PAS domain S-box protein [Thiorhodococcus minor]
MTSCLHLLEALQAPVLFVALDDGHVRMANAAAARLLGHSVETLEQLPISGIECAEAAQAHWQSRSAGGPASPCRPARLRRADGRELRVEITEIDASQDTPPGTWLAIREASEESTAEQRLRDALSYAHFGYWSLDVATLSGDWSEEIYAIFGIDPATPASPETLRTLLHPEDTERVMRSLNQCCESGIEHRLDYRILRPNGELRWVSCRGKPVCDAEGRPIRIAGFLQDISERQRTAEALRAREQILASIFRTVPIGIGLTRNRILQEVNDGFCAMTGYARDELIGRSTRILYPDDDEFERVGREKYADIRAIGHGEIETRFQRKDGQLIDVLLGSTLVDQDAQIPEVTFTAVDISARKAAERQARETEALFTKAFHAAGTMLSISALADGTYEHVNDAFVEITGYPRDAATGARSIDLGLIAETQRQRMIAALSPDGRVRDLELRLTRADGGVMDCLYNGEVIEIGGEKKLLSIAHDITDLKRAQRQIEAERARAERYLEVAGSILLALDRTGRVTLINPKGCEVIGLPESEILGRDWIAHFIPEEDRGAVESTRGHLLHGDLRTSEYVERHLLTAQGERRLIAWHNSLIRDTDGEVIGTLASGDDVTEQRAAEQALREERSFLQHVIDGIEDPILVVDRDRRVLRMNQAARMKATQVAAAHSELRCHELLYQSHEPCNSDARRCPLHRVLETGKPCKTLHSITGMGGERTHEVAASPLRSEDGAIQGVIEISHDITDHLELLEALHAQDLRYAHLAQYDPLTELPNRFLFSDRLSQAIQVAQRSRSKLAVLFLDLDQFKQINDSFDHSDGDAVLIALARRLEGLLRGADTLARMGGDEFSIILSDIKHDEDAAKVARAMLALFKSPFEIRGHRLFLGASIGISLYPEHGTTTEDLVRNADAALFRAKAEGRNNFQYYSQDLTAKAFERILLESSLHDAIANQELVLHYQPQLHLPSRKVCGVEALVRWQHPSMGLVPPDRFIPLAESTGLIVPMGEWVLREACVQMGHWLQSGKLPHDALMGVNLSARQLAQEDLVDKVQDAIEAAGLSPTNLELEITETSVMASPELSASRLGRLRDLGVKLAMDDFGTGYSSLSYLKQLPLTKLKIDRSFVSDIPEDANDTAIAKAIIALGESLSLEVLAEGIETESQRDFLIEEGCETGQGYLFSRPLPPADLERLLAGDG